VTTRRIAAAATALLLIAAASFWWVHTSSGPEPTPLTGFTAPFVFGRFDLPPDNPLTREAVELGRRLFYDPRLSGSNQISCATCDENMSHFLHPWLLVLLKKALFSCSLS